MSSVDPNDDPEAELLASPSGDPIALFRTWFDDAAQNEPDESEAVAFATASADGAPTVRMVLLKHFDQHGFIVYTNLSSTKGRQAVENPRASLCFHWKSLARQVRVDGLVEQVEDDVADNYFNGRPRSSRIGAWASRQSEELSGRFELEREVAKYTARYAVGKIPRPPHWSGLRIVPETIEFWNRRPFRLHDRVVYRQTEGIWEKHRLFP